MPTLRIQLQISPDQMLDYYRGLAKTVYARADNGQSVQFPAGALQQYITKDGIHGWFELEFDGAKKFVSLKRSPEPDGPLDRLA